MINLFFTYFKENVVEQASLPAQNIFSWTGTPSTMAS